MPAWSDVERAAPDLAAAVRARFEAHRHKVLATLRADGSPRLSGIETTFKDGELWLGMMPDSRKVQDLRRDPRLALHTPPADADLTEPDARISGRAVEATEPDAMARLVEEMIVTPTSPPRATCSASTSPNCCSSRWAIRRTIS